jgi:3-phenylpropionate/cinnamic acid dioxygenase small subunit
MTIGTATAVDLVADDLAIRNLICHMSHLNDCGDLDEYVNFYTDGATWEMPGNPQNGRPAIRAAANSRREAGLGGPGSHSRHIITTQVVHVDGSDDARTESNFLFYVNIDAEPTLRLIGRYHDTVVRTADGWRVSRRQILLG